MHISVGIILYILVTILSSLLKKAAEDKSKGQPLVKTTLGKPRDVVPEVVSLDEIEGALVQRFQEIADENAQEVKQLENIEVVNEDDLSWQSSSGELEETEEPQTSVKDPERQRTLGRQPSLVQAVVMAEIIRPPRAKRPWPSR